MLLELCLHPLALNHRQLAFARTNAHGAGRINNGGGHQQNRWADRRTRSRLPQGGLELLLKSIIRVQAGERGEGELRDWGIIPFFRKGVTLGNGQTPFAPTYKFPSVALILEIGIRGMGRKVFLSLFNDKTIDCERFPLPPLFGNLLLLTWSLTLSFVSLCLKKFPHLSCKVGAAHSTSKDFLKFCNLADSRPDNTIAPVKLRYEERSEVDVCR